MVKDEYFRYEHFLSAGTIASSSAPAIYDPSHKYAFSAALEAIHVWNIRSSTLAYVLRDSSAKALVTALALIAPSTIVSGYDDGTIRLWEDNELKIVFSGHRGAVTSFDFDSSTQRLASAGKDSDIVIWDVLSQSGLFRLKGHSNGITQVKFIKNSNLLVSAGRDSLIKVWELTTQLCVHNCVDHKASVNSFAISEDQKTLISVSDDNIVRIFALDASTLAKVVQNIEYHEKGFALVGHLQRFGKERALQVQLKGSVLAVLSAEKLLEFFIIKSADEVKRKLKRKQKQDEASTLNPADLISSNRILRFDCKAFSFDMASEERVLIGLADNNVVEYIVPKDKEQQVKRVSGLSYSGHRGPFRGLSFSPNSDLVASISAESLKLWNAESLKVLSTVDFGEQVGQCLAFLDENIVAVGCKSGDLLLVDTSSGEISQVLENNGSATSGITHMHFQYRSLVASSGQQIRFWEVKPATAEKPLRLKSLKTLQLNETAGALCQSPDGKLLAVALLDLTIKVFFMDTLKFFLNLYGHKLPINSLDIAFDNKTLISGSSDKNIKIWGLDFGDLRKSIYAHNDSVTLVKFASESLFFFSASKDGQIKYWNARNFEALMKLDGVAPGNFGITSLVASSNSVIAAGQDIRLWKSIDEPLFPKEEQANEMDALLEEDLLAENPFVKEDEEVAMKATKKTLKAINASEKIIEALEAADSEVMRLEMQSAEPQSTLFIALSSGATPSGLVANTIDRIDFAELEEALLALPNRLLPSLLRHLKGISEEKSNLGTQLLPLVRCILLAVKVFYREINIDRLLAADLKAFLANANPQLRNYRELIACNLALLDSMKTRIIAN